MFIKLYKSIKSKTPRSTYQRLNQMIDRAMDGNFSEQEFEETELSKLETKWKRFLVSAKQSNQKLEEERKNIKELVSDISHQTKTSLANILLYSQLLTEQNLDETSQNLVSEIVKQSEKLEFLIQSLVKTSRLEAGTFQFHVKPQNILPMIMDIVEQGASKAEKRKMHLRVNGAGLQGIKVIFDKKWTGEALYNILDNAIKYGEEGSLIEIFIKAYEMFVCINICNMGTGISEQEMPRIFQRFYRGENAKETEGVGIGLYLARQIVEEQGGYIKVSTKEGKEVCFSVYLPKKI